MQTQISHHLLLCATPTKEKCCDPTTGIATWNELKRVIRELGLENTKRPEGIVLRSKVDCLRICKRGPVLVVWPDGIWYTEVTADKIEPIVQQHIVRQQPIHKWIYKTTPFKIIQMCETKFQIGIHAIIWFNHQQFYMWDFHCV